MALLFMDGFDHYTSADIPKKYSTWTGVNTNIYLAPGRRGNGLMFQVNNSSSGWVTKTIPNTSTIILGAALKLNPVLTGGYDMISFLDGSTPQVTLSVTTTGLITVARGVYNGTLLGTSSAGLNSSTFNYVEVKVVFNNVGSVQVKLNGQVVLNVTGVDTTNTVNAYCNAFKFGSSVNTTGDFGATIDDVYVCDTTSTVNNDFLGDVRVDTLSPNADGTYRTFTPSTGTDHFSLINAGIGAGYVSGANLGDKDSYQFSDLDTIVDPKVYAVQVNVAAMKDDTGTRGISAITKVGATEQESGNTMLPTSITYISNIFDTNSGQEWTQTDINNAEFGVKIST